MQIRLACPNCQKELVSPGSAAGTRSKCPRCQCAFLIPIPTAQTLPDKPSGISSAPASPNASVGRDETPVPEQLMRERPRPVYKQTPPAGTRSSSELKTHRSGRHRRKVKINQPTPINKNVVIGSIVGGFVLISCIVFLFMKMGSAPKTETKSGDVLSGKSLLEDKPDIFDTMPKTYRMPMGWSKTDKEKTGFDSIWPVKGGTAGFTMVEKELTVRGMPNEYWSYTDIEKKITYTIESLKLSEVESNDFENTKKRFVEKIRRGGLNDIQESERELDNRPTLLLVGVKKDTRTTMKIQWTKGHIWTAKVECPLDISFGDSKVWDFLHNFKLD